MVVTNLSTFNLAVVMKPDMEARIRGREVWLRACLVYASGEEVEASNDKELLLGTTDCLIVHGMARFVLQVNPDAHILGAKVLSKLHGGKQFRVGLKVVHRGKVLSKDKFFFFCLLYTSPSPRDPIGSRMPSSA